MTNLLWFLHNLLPLISKRDGGVKYKKHVNGLLYHPRVVRSVSLRRFPPGFSIYCQSNQPEVAKLMITAVVLVLRVVEIVQRSENNVEDQSPTDFKPMKLL